MKILAKLQQIITTVGYIVASFTILMMLITFIVVIIRHGFNTGNIELFEYSISTIMLNETVMYMHAMLFTLGSAATLHQNGHVRVDVFYRHFSNRIKSVINIMGTLLLLFPMCAVIIGFSWDYVLASWSSNERSIESEGLAYLFVLKAMLPAMGLLLILQGILDIIKHGLFLQHKAPYPLCESE